MVLLLLFSSHSEIHAIHLQINFPKVQFQLFQLSTKNPEELTILYHIKNNILTVRSNLSKHASLNPPLIAIGTSARRQWLVFLGQTMVFYLFPFINAFPFLKNTLPCHLFQLLKYHFAFYYYCYAC